MSNTRKLKIGFIGAGSIARGGHLNHLSRWDDVDLVAFCDVFTNRITNKVSQTSLNV